MPKAEPITKLYHGTTESIAKMACAKGLSSYDLNLFGQNINPASNGCINLTSVYAGMMALNASDRGKWGIIEIDVLKLDPERFVPSDIYLLDKAKSYPKTEKDYADQLLKIQPKLLVYKKSWRESLDKYGVCGYSVDIPANAINKVTIYDPNSNWFITKSLASNMVVGSKLHNVKIPRNLLLTRWLLGEAVTGEQWVPGFSSKPHAERDQIITSLRNKHGLDIYYMATGPKK